MSTTKNDQEPKNEENEAKNSEVLKDEEKKWTKKNDYKAMYTENLAELEALKVSYDKLKEELGLAKAAAKESMEMVKIFKLDVDRIKERSEKLNRELSGKLSMNLALKIIPVIDNFEQALNHVKLEGDKKGFSMIYTGLIKALEDMNVKQITVTAGVFDPNKMEAVLTDPTDNPELSGTVSKVLQTGYYYEPTDEVLRYTKVSVFKN